MAPRIRDVRAMLKRNTSDNVAFASERRRSDDEVAHLIDHIRRLVAEQRRLEGGSESERREANRDEIGRLQDRLAFAVRRALRR
jgi:hypothetical protein